MILSSYLAVTEPISFIMRELIWVTTPILSLLCFLTIIYKYQKLCKLPPSKQLISNFQITIFLLGIFNFFLLIGFGKIENEWRKISISGYKSKEIHVDAETEDYYSYYKYSSKDKFNNEKISGIKWLLIALLCISTILSAKWFSEMTNIDKWEFKYIADYKEREIARKEKEEWYKKHPNRLKPVKEDEDIY